MNKARNNFPFFAGEKTPKEFSHAMVLSPFPIRTGIKKNNYCEQLLSKNNNYIEIGGVAGLIFQTQIVWLMFLISFVIVFIPVYIMLGGITSMYELAYETKFINGIPNRTFSYFEFGNALFALFGPLIATLAIIFLVIKNTNKSLLRTIPFRFNRQRREVMFSKWNKAKKQTQVKFFKWEDICAMVGQGSAVTTVGVISSSALVIAADDNSKYGNFWSSMTLNAINKIDATSTWEMIRSYMEEGEEAVPEPEPLTYAHLLKQHCEANNISPSEVTGGTKLWWYLNGTMLGIWRTNRLMKKMTVHAESFPEVVEWSKPLPKSKWAKPSEELEFYNRIISQNEYAKGHTILSIGNVREKYGHLAPSKQSEVQAEETF
ncbi:DUF6708 domain-containing protein [Vibrio sp. LaRot3]|uniref:DUF6708 domain-containing protein n=1 Tax=Vibrio sp. LaRot3 TaxID=2998829 RepID=UPI0022CE1F53|nr:DUF6708 domain-containing protein [Vibrio sp. LaRot3]MDA0150463.1 hypothetical protein [Vibrio sp. LaRot3]